MKHFLTFCTSINQSQGIYREGINYRYNIVHLLPDRFTFCRQLAQNQVGWFKRAPSFHWVNIAPGGERLALSEVAMAVKEWFLQDTPLPQPWDGSCLQTLVRWRENYASTGKSIIL